MKNLDSSSCAVSQDEGGACVRRCIGTYAGASRTQPRLFLRANPRTAETWRIDNCGCIAATFMRLPSFFCLPPIARALLCAWLLENQLLCRLDSCMTTASEELIRRRPVWQALSDLFLDTELTEAFYRLIARTVIESGYSPGEIGSILWDEVFPVIEFNLRHPAGVWDGFRVEWLEERILGGGERQTAQQQPGTARIVQEAWSEVCRYLPSEYK